MKYSDFFIDLNDLYGRLVSGVVILLDLYFLSRLIVPKYVFSGVIIMAIETNSFLLIVLFLVFSLILGEFSLRRIFRLGSRLVKKISVEEYLQKQDPTADKRMVQFFKLTFDADILKKPHKSLLGYCKDYLVQKCPLSYKKASQVEARINFKAGMIMPLYGAILISIFYTQWILALISFALLLSFIEAFYASINSEASFVYKAYYFCCNPGMEDKDNRK